VNVPVVLPVARIRIDDAGLLSVSLNDEPHAADETYRRADLQQLLADITNDIGSPIRVEVTESDGTKYVDIATPTDEPLSTDAADPGGEPESPGVRGTGFRPGERVAVAYVLLHETADSRGATTLRLPAAALGRRQGALLLFGLDSLVGTLIEHPA